MSRLSFAIVYIDPRLNQHLKHYKCLNQNLLTTRSRNPCDLCLLLIFRDRTLPETVCSERGTCHMTSFGKLLFFIYHFCNLLRLGKDRHV